MNGMETYVRLRNCGLSVKWSRDKNIYHPWHKNTLGSGFSEAKIKEMQILRWAKVHLPWINPGRFEQSWIVFCREKYIRYEANFEECTALLKNILSIDFNLYENIEGSFLRK